MANLISIFRVVLAFYLLIMLKVLPTQLFFLTAVGLTLAVILLDALDGIVARALHEESDIGSVLDILGDRIVENAYWIVFATYGWISVAVPLIVMTRSFIADTLRGLAFAKGFTAFGSKSMIKNKIGAFFTSSRISRAVYGGAKIFAFMTVIACHVPGMPAPEPLVVFQNVCVWTTVVLCVIRVIPVILESKPFLFPEKEA